MRLQKITKLFQVLGIMSILGFSFGIFATPAMAVSGLRCQYVGTANPQSDCDKGEVCGHPIGDPQAKCMSIATAPGGSCLRDLGDRYCASGMKCVFADDEFPAGECTGTPTVNGSPASSSAAGDTMPVNETPSTGEEDTARGCCVKSLNNSSNFGLGNCLENVSDLECSTYSGAVFYENDATCSSFKSPGAIEADGNICGVTPGATAQPDTTPTTTGAPNVYGCCALFTGASKTQLQNCIAGMRDGLSCEGPAMSFYAGSDCFNEPRAEILRGCDAYKPPSGSQPTGAANSLSNGLSCQNDSQCQSGYCALPYRESLPSEKVCMERPGTGTTPAAANSGGGLFSGIVPCGRTADDPRSPTRDESQSCSLCHLIIGIQGMVKWGLAIMIPIALLMLTIAGVYYTVSAGNEHMMQSAKGFMTSVLIGMSVVIGGWVIINTTLYIVGAKQDFGINQNSSTIKAVSWNRFECIVTNSQHPR